MIVLLDTSTPVCRLTVVNGDERRECEWDAGRQLARGLLGYLRDQIGELHALTDIGVMKGPGSFTGLRIGLTVANTLADDLGIPIVGETGEEWQARALGRLAAGENEQIVMPEYGGDAHITLPRK